MTKRIWKYTILASASSGIFSIPRLYPHPHGGGPVMFVDSQGPNTIAFWVEVDPEQATEMREFLVFGTGQDIPEGLNYLGSAIDGNYVWHLYEKIR